MVNQEQNLPQPEQPFVAAKQVNFNLKDIILNTNNKVALLYLEHTIKEYFKYVFDFISKCCLRKPFTRSPNMYQEYLVEFWYSAKALENSKVSFLIPIGCIYKEVGLNTFRNAIGVHYLPYSSEYVAPPSIDVVRKWFPTIRYGEEISTKGTLRKSLLPPRWRLLMAQIIQCLGGKIDKPMVFKALKTSSRAESISQGAKPEAKTRHKKPVTSSKQPFVSSKEATKGHDVLANFTAEADPGLSAPNDSIPLQQDQTKSVSEGLETVLTQPITEKEAISTTIHGDKEESSNTIKLKDLAKLVSQIQPSFKDLDLPKDDPVIIVDESDEDEPTAKTKDTSLNELLVKSLQTVFSMIISSHDFSSSLPTELKWELPEEFLSLQAKVESAQAKLNTLDALPSLLLNVTKALNKFAEVLESTSIKAGDQKEAKAEAAKQERNVRKAKLIDLLGPEVVHKYYNYKLQYDRYCDKMLNRRVESRITNCDVLTRKWSNYFLVYREDGAYEVTLNFKDRLDKLNDLANKKRKHVDDIHDYFKATKRVKSSVEYGDHLPSIMLNEAVFEIFFRRHQGLGVDDHARTFSSLLLVKVDKRNLNPLKQMRTIEQLRR
nr:hypothetical protein [Tanacetum cinerariifolium]